jgi:Fic-DOC domain mobile mystery protein B
MLGEIWSWAGKFRKTDKNLGLDKHKITSALRVLLDDCKYWIEHKTFSPEEIAIQFKHRLVSIHCFPKGNGRHSRLMGDLIIEKIFEENIFTWGAKNLVLSGQYRTKYLEALHNADKGNYEDLIKFARS